MICPVCETDTIVIEVDQVELDHCIRCRGIWLDAGELQLLIEMSGADAGPLTEAIYTGGAVPPGQKRLCPVCGKKMFEVEIPGPPRVTVDRCPEGDGLWLDDNELGPLIDSTGGVPESEALARLCGKMLKSERSKSQDEANDVGTDSSQ